MKLQEAIENTSHKEQVEAYSSIVNARRLWQSSIVNAQKQYHEQQRILKRQILKRVKNNEGELINPQDAYDNRMQFMISNRQNLSTLQTLQKLEREIMNALGASIGILPADTMQDITFYIPAE
jgi:hypothetical protein